MKIPADADYGEQPIGQARPDGVVPVLRETMKAGVYTTKNRDVLDQWLESEEIDKPHLNAGRAFERDYVDAHLAARVRSCMVVIERVDGSGGDYQMSHRYTQASRKAAEAMDAMGKRGSAAIEAVVCNGESMRGYSSRCGTSVDVIKGLMLGALDVLVEVYRTGD